MVSKAAAQDNAAAQFNLSLCYGEGKGIPKNLVASVKWLQKSAALEYPFAQNNLGSAYANGQGIKRDDRKAVSRTEKPPNKMMTKPNTIWVCIIWKEMAFVRIVKKP